MNGFQSVLKQICGSNKYHVIPHTPFLLTLRKSLTDVFIAVVVFFVLLGISTANNFSLVSEKEW